MAGMDWVMMAAQCYQESCFDPKAHSWAGACGLMQIMPATADHLALPRGQMYEPETNIAAAARYMRVFQGQPYSAGVSYLRDMGSLSAKPQQLSLMPMADDAAQLELQDLINDSGFKNEALQLTDADLVQNIRALQAESNIHQYHEEVFAFLCQKVPSESSLSD